MATPGTEQVAVWAYGYVGDSSTVVIVPQVSVALKLSEVAGCKNMTGTLTLASPAPEGGMVVALSETLASATVPSTVTIPAGATAANFTIKTTAVAVSESGAVSVTYAGSTASQMLTVRPMGMLSVSLTPINVVGSKTAVGKATLECKAAPGAIMVDLASSKPAVASPEAASISVPQGLQSQSFDVTTNPVLVKTSATISGTANGITKSKALNVTPAAVVSPTSLKFGNVVVGTTSSPIRATLTNKGAVPFSVGGISLTGTYASWFAEINSCLEDLAPGESCEIDVTFTPKTAASRSAKLTIATSATATPLSVSVSGTGL